MKKDLIKLIVALVVTLIFIGLIVLVTLVDLDLALAKTYSVESLLKKHAEVTSAEDKLLNQEKTYKTSVASVETEEQNYKTEKMKYDAISQETIDIINEATLKENYNIEYMWIKLGNYAKRSNLAIVLTEPNGKAEKPITPNGTTENTTTNTTEETSTNATTPDSTVSSTLFKMQVTGSYINVSDFVFNVENDKELRFKLDNIVMEYVSGTTIRATFNVKNMVIQK